MDDAMRDLSTALCQRVATQVIASMPQQARLPGLPVPTVGLLCFSQHAAMTVFCRGLYVTASPVCLQHPQALSLSPRLLTSCHCSSVVAAMQCVHTSCREHSER